MIVELFRQMRFDSLIVKAAHCRIVASVSLSSSRLCRISFGTRRELFALQAGNHHAFQRDR
jgi:hypothetical protein